MKRIKPQEITEKLSDEQLIALAELANEIPISIDWIECSKKLNDEQKFQVYQKRGELLEEKEQDRLSTMTIEEKKEEVEKQNRLDENIDSFSFYGNMGQPTTMNEYKNRYGGNPPGYNENINPHDLPDILTNQQVESIGLIYIDYISPQYWSEIYSELLNRNTNQLERVFNWVYQLTGSNFPLNGSPLRQLTIEEFKEKYGIWPPGYDKK